MQGRTGLSVGLSSLTQLRAKLQPMFFLVSAAAIPYGDWWLEAELPMQKLEKLK
jgi:hypothetical protein